MKRIEQLRKRIRIMIALFIVALFFSGLTAIPVDWQLSILLNFLPPETLLSAWLSRVLMAYRETNEHFPFLLYGYDWLAFAHFVLAILFLGPFHDPVRNIWVIRFGMIASVLVIPFTFIAGPFREIPFEWQLIDCSFGAFALVLLYPCYRGIRLLENLLQQLPENSCRRQECKQGIPIHPPTLIANTSNH